MITSLLLLTGHTIPDASQDAIGLLVHLGTLPAHVQTAVKQQSQFSFSPKPAALHGVVVTEVQDLALSLVETYGPSIQPVQIPL